MKKAKQISISLAVAVLFTGVFAMPVMAETAAGTALESELLKLHTLEEAFLKAIRQRNLLHRFVLQEEQKLQALTETADEAAISEIRRNIGEARKQLNTLNIAMEVAFGIGNRRDYEYNTVTSTVYLKVGTVEEAFARTVRARDLLQAFVGEKQKELEATTAADAKQELEAQILNATRQYQLVQASLQQVFGVVQARNYLYNPQNATLYLRITAEEMENIKLQIEELQKQQLEAAAAK